MAAEKLSGRPCRCQQASATTSNYRLGTSSYTNVRSTMQHLVKQDKHVNKAGRTPIHINMMTTQMQLRNDAADANCKLNEFRVGT
jgi:hypothetical protein